MNKESESFYEKVLSHRCACYLIIALSLYSIVGIGLGFNQSVINKNILWCQLISLISVVEFIIIGLRTNINNILRLILIYQICFSYVLYIDFKYVIDDFLGYNPVDSRLYSDIAILTSNYSLHDFLKYLSRAFDSESDYGFPFFLKYIYCIFPNDAESAHRLLIFINCILQVISCHYLWRICHYLNIDKTSIKWILLLWGINPCSVYLNASGLKEPLFCFLCMGVMTYIYSFAKKRTIKSLIILLFFLIATWFFRNYMTLFFIIIFCGYCIVNKLYKRIFSFIIIASIVVCIGFTSILTEYFPEIYYAILHSNEILPSGISSYFYYVLSFLSPIPKFYNIATPQMLLIVVYSMIKFSLSIYGIIGAYYIIKYKQTDFYPLINIVVFTILMLIVSAHYIDYRYMYPIIPCYIILMVYGLRYCKSIISYSYLILSSIVITLFNLQIY